MRLNLKEDEDDDDATDGGPVGLDLLLQSGQTPDLRRFNLSNQILMALF